VRHDAENLAARYMRARAISSCTSLEFRVWLKNALADVGDDMIMTDDASRIWSNISTACLNEVS
jgi:hypothetical protein